MNKHIYIIAGLVLVLTQTAFSQYVIGPNELDVSEQATYTHSSGETNGVYIWHYTGNYTIIREVNDTLIIKWNSDDVVFVKLHDDQDNYLDDMMIVVGNPQSIEYVYDAAGNRTSRQIVLLGSNNNQGGSSESDIIEQIEEMETRQFKVYPNPANQHVFVCLNDKALEYPDPYIIVYDLNGKTVLQTNALDEIIQIDLSTFQKGVYILRLVYGNNTNECKIIKY